MHDAFATALATNSEARRSRQRLLRVWTAPVSRANDAVYLAFAYGRSRPMLLAQPGCEAVHFLRLDEYTQAVVTLWSDDAAILACEHSQAYRQTVEDLIALGVMGGTAGLTVIAVEPPLLKLLMVLLEHRASH